MASTESAVGAVRPLGAAGLGPRVSSQGIVCQGQVAWAYDGRTLSFASTLSGSPMHSITLAPLALVAVLDTASTVAASSLEAMQVLLVLRSAEDVSFMMCLHRLPTQQFSRGVVINQPLVDVCWLGKPPSAMPQSRACIAATSRSGELALFDLTPILADHHPWSWDIDTDPLSSHTLQSKAVCHLGQLPEHFSYSAQLHTLLALGATKGVLVSLNSDQRVQEFEQERRRSSIVDAVAYAIVSDGTRYIMIATMHGNQPALELYHVQDDSIAYDEDFTPLANTMQLPPDSGTIVTIPSLCVCGPSLSSSNDDDDDDDSTTVMCTIAATTGNRCDVAVVVIDEDARLSSAWEENISFAFRHEVGVDLDAEPTAPPAFSVDLASIYRYHHKNRAEVQETQATSESNTIPWPCNVSLQGTLLVSNTLVDVHCYGAQEAVLQRLSTLAVPMLCEPEETYARLKQAGLVAGTAQSPKDMRDAALEVLMFNGMTGAVGAYTRYLIAQANLPMSARTLHAHDTLGSLWDWLLSFWRRYMRVCKRRFVEYLQGTPFSDNDVQPVLVMLSAIVKTLSGTAGSEETLETIRQQEALIKDCIRLFKVIAWCEQNGFNESLCEWSALYSMAAAEVLRAAAADVDDADGNDAVALDKEHFTSVRAFLKSKLPMNSVALACVYRMVVSTNDRRLALSFADALELPTHLVALVDGVAAMDQDNFEEGLALLSTADVPVFAQQHVQIVQHLCSRGHPALALKYWQAHEHRMLGSFGVTGDTVAMVDLLLSSSQLPFCFTRLRQARQQGHDTTAAMDFLFQRCLDDRTVKSLLDLPLDEEEGQMLQSFLARDDATSSQRQEALLLFLLLKSRICDAFQVHYALNARSDVPEDRAQFRAALMHNYKTALPQYLARRVDNPSFQMPFDEFVASLDQTKDASVPDATAASAASTAPGAYGGVSSPAMSHLLKRAPTSTQMQTQTHPAVHRVQPSRMPLFARPPATPLDYRPKSRSRLNYTDATPRRLSMHETSFAALATPPEYASPTLQQRFAGAAHAGIMEESMAMDETTDADASAETSKEHIPRAAAMEEEDNEDEDDDDEEDDEEEDDDDDVTINLPKVMSTPSTSASTSFMSDRHHASMLSTDASRTHDDSTPATPTTPSTHHRKDGRHVSIAEEAVRAGAAGRGGTDLPTPRVGPTRTVTDNMGIFSPQTPAQQHQQEEEEEKQEEEEEQEDQQPQQQEQRQQQREEAEPSKEVAETATTTAAGAVLVMPSVQRAMAMTPRKAPSSPLARTPLTAQAAAAATTEKGHKEGEEEEHEARATLRHHLLHSLRSASSSSSSSSGGGGGGGFKPSPSSSSSPALARTAVAGPGSVSSPLVSSKPSSPMVRLSRPESGSVQRSARLSTPRSAARVPSIALPRRKRETPPGKKESGGLGPVSSTPLKTAPSAAAPPSQLRQQRGQRKQPEPFSPDVSMAVGDSPPLSEAPSFAATPLRGSMHMGMQSSDDDDDGDDHHDSDHHGVGMHSDDDEDEVVGIDVGKPATTAAAAAAAAEAGMAVSRRVHVTPSRPNQASSHAVAVASPQMPSTPDVPTFSPPLTRLSARKRGVQGRGRAATATAAGVSGLSTDSPVALPTTHRGHEGEAAKPQEGQQQPGRAAPRRTRAKRKKGSSGSGSGGVSHGMTLRSGRHTTPSRKNDARP